MQVSKVCCVSFFLFIKEKKINFGEKFMIFWHSGYGITHVKKPLTP